MIGYEKQRCLRHRNYVVFLSSLTDHAIPSFIVDTSQLLIQPDSIVNDYLGDNSIFLGWGNLQVNKIENDSLIYCYTESIE